MFINVITHSLKDPSLNLRWVLGLLKEFSRSPLKKEAL